MAQLTDTARELTRIRHLGEVAVSELESEFRRAQREYEFLVSALASLQPSYRQDHDTAALLRKTLDRVQGAKFRYDKVKEVFTQFQEHANRIICGDCKGFGKIRYAIYKDESEYKDCSDCGGTGVRR
jgi:hypothetical protein